MTIPWLSKDPALFPDTKAALKDPNGLLAAGGDLSKERLFNAYRRGIFPWYNKDALDSPILWWCPDPRNVLFLDRLKVSRSLRKSMRNKGYTTSFDMAFAQVIRHCAASRKNADGTWIHPEMIKAYIELAGTGHAHSVECWHNDELVGGLYGVQIGSMFFGESMFSLETDTSKVCLVYLCTFLKEQDVALIDCQIHNAHLSSLGAEEIPLGLFLTEIDKACNKVLTQNWPTDTRNPDIYYQTVYGKLQANHGKIGVR